MAERTKQNYKDYYEILKSIGCGSYGCVCKGRDKKTKELRATKIIDIRRIEENNMKKKK